MLNAISAKMSLTMLTIIASLICSPCLGAVKGDVELLKTVALRHKANFESILTWKGEAFEERISTEGDWYDYLMKNKCTFAYDRLRNAVRWNKYPRESHCINHGEPQIVIFANNNSAMFKDQSYYEYTGFKQPDDTNKVTYHLAIADPKMARGKHNESLDPRYLFADAPGHSVHGKLMFLYNNANVEGPFDYYVKREGDLVIFEVSPDETRMLREVYDLAAGGNRVEYYNKTPTAENTMSYTYEEKSGVWVLKSLKGTNVTYRKNGEVHRSARTVNWSNSVVNVPFEEDEFTLEKLGVKDGDLISDHRIEKGYIYKGVLEVPPAPSTLMGKHLPELKDVEISMSPPDTTERIILVCFWGMNQRPSRYCMQQLSERAQELKEKGIVVVAVQASKVDKSALDEWIKKYNVPFSVGMVRGDEEKVRFAWGVKSLPWLILTDKEHIVQAEGFALTELDEELEHLGDK